MRRNGTIGLLCFAAVLPFVLAPGGASAGTASFVVVDAGGGSLKAIVKANPSSPVLGTWFVYGIERHASLPCAVDEVFPIGLGPGRMTGANGEEWTFQPFFPRSERICIYLSDTDGYGLAAESIITVPAGYGKQRSSGYNCSSFVFQRRAQYYLQLYPSDPSGIDADHDGIACEDLECSCGAERIPAEPEPSPPLPVVAPAELSPTAKPKPARRKCPKGKRKVKHQGKARCVKRRSRKPRAKP